MRHLEVSAVLPASAQVAWAALIDVEQWPNWGRLVVSAEGEFTPGHRWTMDVRGDAVSRIMRPYFLSMIPGRQLVFETRLGASWLVNMRHWFDLTEEGPDRSLLTQRWEVTGLFVRPLWSQIEPGILQFDQLGTDLADHLRKAPSPTA